MEEGDSLLSTASYYPSRSNGHRPIPPSFSRADSSFSYPVRQPASSHSTPWRGNAEDVSIFQGQEDQEEEEGPEEEEEEEIGEEEDDDLGGSETSSIMFDAEADPEGFAKRLDELAGVLEKSEQEVRALKWGPPIGKGVKGGCSCPLVSSMNRVVMLTIAMSMPVLAHEDFKALTDHHLNVTEWKYTTNDSIPGHGLDGPTSLMLGLEGAAAEAHPVHVILPEYAIEGLGDDYYSGGQGETSVLGIEGLPASMSLRCE